MVTTARAIHADLNRRLDARSRANFAVGPWRGMGPLDGAETVMLGGYLLNHSDDLHAGELADELVGLARRSKATRSILYTTWSKSRQLDSLAVELEARGWDRSDLAPSGWPLQGKMQSCHELRGEWYRGLNVGSPWLYREPPDYEPKDDIAHAAFQHPNQGAAVGRLFTTSSGLALPDDDQERAALPDSRLTVVVGAAGSGKSRVLAKRVAATAAKLPRAQPPRILVTAFNKPMIDQAC